MLTQYLQQTERLLNDFNMSDFNPADLTYYVNIARNQIAGEWECIRAYVTLPVSASAQQYPFSDISLTAYPGVAGVLHVRQVTYAVASGQSYVHPRPFPWFNLYILSQAVPQAGVPTVYSQYGQGANGTLFINLPDTAYTLSLDTVCYANVLVNDADAEALPYPWTDAVPFFAAYFACLGKGQTDQCEIFLSQYQAFADRARKMSTPAVLPNTSVQTGDPTAANKLGAQGGLQGQRGA